MYRKSKEELEYEKTFGFEDLNDKIFRGENQWEELQQAKRANEDYRRKIQQAEDDLSGQQLFEGSME